jgi:hypothetical protein
MRLEREASKANNFGSISVLLYTYHCAGTRGFLCDFSMAATCAKPHYDLAFADPTDCSGAPQ